MTASPDAMTWTSDNRPRPNLMLSTNSDGDLDLTIDDPTPEQFTEALVAFGALMRDPGRSRP